MRSQHFLEHLLLQITDPTIGTRQFLIRTVVLSQNRQRPRLVHLDIKALFRQGLLQLPNTLAQRTALPDNFSQPFDQRLPHTFHNTLTDRRLLDVLQFVPQNLSEFGIIVPKIARPHLSDTIDVMRTTAAGSHGFSGHEVCLLELRQSLADCRRRHSDGRTDLSNGGRAQSMKLLEKLLIVLFQKDLHERLLAMRL